MFQYYKLSLQKEYFMRKLWLLFYYIIAKNLPDSYLPVVGPIANKIRIATCRHIFAKTGKVSVIQKGVHFGTGEFIEIGDYSGIGKNSLIPNNTIIGNYVMVGQDLFIVANNHNFSNTEIPMALQDPPEHEQTVIEDDVWIGTRVVIMPGKRIGKGSVIGAGSVLTKNTGEYEIWAGVPARFIRSRKS